MVGYCLRQLLIDSLTLAEYERGDPVSWESIKRRLVLNERKINYHITDNQLHIALSSYELDNLEELFLKGLPQLGSEFLECRNNLLYVKSNMFSKWQELITLCPPLVIIAAFASKNNFNIDYIQDTALLPPYIKELEKIKKRNQGFNDLHIHLNGSTEADVLWQDILFHTSDYVKTYDNAIKKKPVIEQSEQELVLPSTLQLSNLLARAKALRYFLNHYCINQQLNIEYPLKEVTVNEYVGFLDPNIHPYNKNIHFKNKTSDLNCELQLLIKLFDTIIQVDNITKPNLIKALHHYLLIQGVLNRFVTQQIHQKGFQQFQKIVSNNLRRKFEKQYTNRFLQLNGNDEGNFKILEGRIAPEKDDKNNNKLIDDIRKGWIQFKKEKSNKKQELHLIYHFIKKDVGETEIYFHENLRKYLLKQAQVILNLKNNRANETEDFVNNFKKLVSVDAASSEFETPPEVFAQVFRLLRAQNAVTNYTYHVGEDFIHIVSGLRAIFEAIDFLEMKEGDRLGHVTALGVCPRLWKERIGDSVYISKSEWLDNLLFIYDFFKLKQGKQLRIIQKQINKISRHIYPQIKPSINDLIIAWRFRRWDPTLFFADSVSNIPLDLRGDYNFIKTIKLTYTQKMLVEYYFRNHNCKRGNEKILVDFDLIDLEILGKVQMKLGEYIKNKGIIVETLPTSNVRIGIYNNYKEHHLKSWITPSNMINNQKVVVGCDDAGIFATNIYNEFAHIYLMYSDKNVDIINQLVQNSEQAVFKI